MPTTTTKTPRQRKAPAVIVEPQVLSPLLTTTPISGVVPETPPESDPVADTVQPGFLHVYAPDGGVVAKSGDGGKSWIRTEHAVELERQRRLPVPREFTRKIVAVVNITTPSVEKRIAGNFGPLHRAGILAGWAPFVDLMQTGTMSQDAVVIPGPGPEQEHFDALRQVAPVLMLDIDAPMALDEEGMRLLHLALKNVDCVTCPTDILAQRLRHYHTKVFTVPPTIRWQFWEHQTRAIAPRKTAVTIGVAPVEFTTDAIEGALGYLKEKYGEKVLIERFDWRRIAPNEEPTLSSRFDVVILPPPITPAQVSSAPLLPAMAAQCAVVADRHYPLILHRMNGFENPVDTLQAWKTLLNTVVMDSRMRILTGRNARQQAKRHTPERLITKLVTPYRLVVPERAPFTISI